jgi:hypothetical protein
MMSSDAWDVSAISNDLEQETYEEHVEDSVCVTLAVDDGSRRWFAPMPDDLAVC